VTSSAISAVDCLRISVTDRCNLRCVYCLPAAGVQLFRREDILRFEEIAQVVGFLRNHYGLRAVRLTGGDPLVRPDIVELAGMLSRLGLDDLAVTTNGQRLAVLARELCEAGVSRVNVSLDSLDRARFSRLTRGGQLDLTLEGIEAAQAAGFRSVKINTVVLRGENDVEVCELVRFAIAHGLEIRFLELMAIGVSAARHSSWFVSSEEVRERLRRTFWLVADGSSPDNRIQVHIARDSVGRTTRVGFISPQTRPFCAGCRRLRLTADGKLLACLMHSSGRDLRPLLRCSNGPDFSGLSEAVRQTLAAKPVQRRLASDRLMAGIGG